MGDNTPGTNESTAQAIDALSKYAPQAIQALNAQTGGTAMSQLGADQAVAPGYNQLYNQGQLASAKTEANIAAGPGQQLVQAANQGQQTVDPQFYQQRQNLSDALTKYLSSYDPSSLTPTETQQISRGINATTGTQTPSAMNTIKNAQTFGSAATQRWQNFGDAITKAASALPQLRSGINAFGVATQRGANTMGTTPGVGQFSTANNFGFANNTLGNIGANQRTIMGINQQNTPLNEALSASETLKNVASAAGSAAGMCDETLKKDVEPYKKGLDVILKLSPKSFTYNDKYPPLSGMKAIGVMAQELDKVAPEMVVHGGTYLEVKQNELIFALINSIKELESRLSYQEARVNLRQL